jgi:hypothetical protein
MNLITKLAYNALTKTIQAIAPGGVSVALMSALGRTDGLDIVSGLVGQKMLTNASSAQNWPATTTQWGDAFSLLLTPGIWVLTFTAETRLNTATGVTGEVEFAIGTASGNSTTGMVRGLNQFSSFVFTGAANSTVMVPFYMVNISASATYYAKLKSGFSGGLPQFVGSFQAIRIA